MTKFLIVICFFVGAFGIGILLGLREHLLTQIPGSQKIQGYSTINPSSVQKPLTDEKTLQKTREMKSLLSDLNLNDPYIPLLTNNKQPTTNNRPSYYDTHPTPSPVPSKMMVSEEVLAMQSVLAQRNILPTRGPEIGDVGTNPVKTTYTLAVLGDSMVDTLGPDLPHLSGLLKENFPNYSFALLNWGQGATDLESGMKRLTNFSKYLDKDYPPLLSYKPDILVVESFAYNHWTPNKYDLDRQWLAIAKIIDTVKEVSPQTKIILAATIAPNSRIYGDGILNWNNDFKWQAAMATKYYLENLVNFATTQNYPLADAYHASLGTDNEGMIKYINGGDHLHPSDEGKLLFSQKIVEAIKNSQLL